MTNPLDISQEKWSTMSALADILHVRFPDGTPLPEIEIGCAGCAKPVSQAYQRGRMEVLGTAFFNVSGLAACTRCRSLTPFSYQIQQVDGEVILEWGGPARRKRQAFANRRWYAWWLRFLGKRH